MVQALAKANAKQRIILENNYGKHDAKKVKQICIQPWVMWCNEWLWMQVNVIKALYADMKLEDAFKEYEEESYKQIQALLSKVTDMPKEVFEFLLKKIYKRSK